MMEKYIFLHLVGTFILVGGIYLSLKHTIIGACMALFGALLLGIGSYLIPSKKTKQPNHQ
ncbi:hypothetical protein [Terribacillus sp. JSM ZJ617]|jgi:drug/metabolite transporter (DMT)-like permease